MLAPLFLLLLAGPTQDGANAFQKGLERVSLFEGKDQWSQAKEALGVLLEEHRERDYVRGRLPELRARITRIHFGLTYEAPDPRDLMSGQVAKYDPATGQIRIRYRSVEGRALDLRDFEDDSGYLVHPLFFVGKHSITLKGPGFDREARLIASASAKRVVRALIEPHGGGAALVFDEGESYRRVLDQEEQRVLRKDKPYELKLIVRKGEVIVTCNKKPLLRAKGETNPGRIGFAGIRPNEVVIEGKATTAWIEDLLSQALGRDRSRFEREFDPQTELPDWLFLVEEAAVILPRLPYPNAERAEHATIWSGIEKLVEAEEYGLAQRLASELDEEQTTEAFREYALAYVDAKSDRHVEARSRLERVLELEPEFFAARVLEATVLLEQGHTPEALETLAQVTVDDPLQVNAWLLLIQLELRAGKLDQAQATIDRALLAGTPPATLEPLNAQLQRAGNGPRWREPARHASEHYRVVSNLSQPFCIEATKILEEAHQLYQTDFPELERESQELYRVYLFAKQNAYLSYVDGFQGTRPERTAGLYVADLGQLLIWNLPDRDAMRRAIRHEAFHQVLDATLPGAPAWLGEGLAEYYKVSDFGRDSAATWRARKALLNVLLEHSAEWVPFDDLLNMGCREFQRAPGPNSAQAWGLAQFLMQAAPEERQRLDGYLTALTQERSWSQAAEAILAGRDAEQLRRAVHAYLVELLDEER